MSTSIPERSSRPGIGRGYATNTRSGPRGSGRRENTDDEFTDWYGRAVRYESPPGRSTSNVAAGAGGWSDDSASDCQAAHGAHGGLDSDGVELARDRLRRLGFNDIQFQLLQEGQRDLATCFDSVEDEWLKNHPAGDFRKFTDAMNSVRGVFGVPERKWAIPGQLTQNMAIIIGAIAGAVVLMLFGACCWCKKKN